MNIPSVMFLKPNRVRRSYKGGYNLDVLEGKKACEDSFYPEDWIASGVRAINDNASEDEKNAGISMIDLDGSSMLFTEFMEKYSEAFLGKRHIAKYGRKIPFLQKFLDSSVRLHFQVHPDIPFARKHLNSEHGKAEAYLILNTRDEIKNPYIYLGFQRPPAREEFKSMVLAQDISRMETYFDKISVKPGDVFFIPGGLPHAIGEGIMMLEIMEPTDFTFLPEYMRNGITLSEKKRYMGLDIDKCLDAVDYTAYSVNEIKSRFMFRPEVKEKNQDFQVEKLFPDNTVPFDVTRLKVSGKYESHAADAWSVNIVTGGNGRISYDSESCLLKEGEKFLETSSSRGFILEGDAIEIIQITSII